MKVIWALIAREFKLFFSNKVLLMLFLGAPLMYGVLIGSVYQKGKVTELPVIIVDEDQSTLSRKLIDMIQENESVDIAQVLPTVYNSRQLALEKEATVVVHIPSGFMRGIQQGHVPEVALFVDGSNTLTSNTALMAIVTVATTMKAGILIESQQKKGVPAYVASQSFEPFKTSIIKQNIRSGNYLYFMLPGVLLTVFQQVLLLGLALSFASEFEQNTFGKLLEKSRNPLLLLFVKIVPYMLMSVGIMLLYYGYSLWFRMPLEVDFGPFALSTFIFVLAVCFIGVMVSIAIPTQLKATEILMVIATPSFILSGFTWPSSQMPQWIQWIADVIPLTHYLRIFRLLFIEQADVGLIRQPLIALGIIALVCFVLSVLLLSRKIRKQQKEEVTSSKK